MHHQFGWVHRGGPDGSEHQGVLSRLLQGVLGRQVVRTIPVFGRRVQHQCRQVDAVAVCQRVLDAASDAWDYRPSREHRVERGRQDGVMLDAGQGFDRKDGRQSVVDLAARHRLGAGLVRQGEVSAVLALASLQQELGSSGVPEALLV